MWEGRERRRKKKIGKGGRRNSRNREKRGKERVKKGREKNRAQGGRMN